MDSSLIHLPCVLIPGRLEERPIAGRPIEGVSILMLRLGEGPENMGTLVEMVFRKPTATINANAHALSRDYTGPASLHPIAWTFTHLGNKSHCF